MKVIIAGIGRSACQEATAANAVRQALPCEECGAGPVGRAV
ncbi:hypothetical protein [Streptomyces sp. NPDC001286]